MTDRSASAPPDSSRSVAEAITAWAKALSDVGGPNTLLWATARPGAFLDLTTAHPGGVSMLMAGRVTHLSDLVREPAAFGESLSRIREIHLRTRRLERERGLACGFVAVGMATWDAPRPGAAIASPVLLRACRLRPSSAAEEDFQIDLARSVEVNPVLVNYLRSVSGIAVDPVSLADLTRVASSFDPYPVYAALTRSCAEVPGFAVAPRLVLGTYPYAKLSMVADLTENAEWLASVDLVAALAGDHPAAVRLRSVLPDVVADPDPARELLVLDADAAQSSVVDAVRGGSSLVVHAPQGTGATQTIAAVVACLAHDGKRTLVVTPSQESIAELSERLGEAGLGHLMLDLAAAATDRHTVAEDLGQTLARVAALDDGELREAGEAPERASRERQLVAARRALVDNVESVHEIRHPWGVSVHEIQAAMAALAFHKPAPGSRIRLRGKAIHQLSRARVDELTREMRAAAAVGAWSDDPSGDPWYGARILSEDDVRQAREIVTRLAEGGLTEPATTLDAILAESAMPQATCVDDWDTALRTMRGVRDTLEVFRPDIFDIPLDEHVVATGSRRVRAGEEVKLGWLARSRVRRQARRMLRPGRPPADLHAELVAAREQRRAWHRLVGAGGRPEISPRLDEAQQVYDVLGADVTWLGDRLTGTQEGGDLARLSLPRLRGRVRRLAARLDRLDVLPRVSPVLATLREAGMGEVLDDFARRGVAMEQVGPELEHIWWASLALDVTQADPRCRDHNGPALHEAAERFRSLDREQREETAAIVRARVDQRARRRLGTHPQQVELLRAQADGQRWLLPFNDLFRECEDVLTALHPCLAMSPYAVAQLLPPGTSFDLVVVDDASGLPTAEVVSALSRGRQALVVGDPHGVAPSPFVIGPTAASRTVTTDEAQPASVLDEAGALLPVRTLSYHHGDADLRLVGWSGAQGDLTGAPRPSTQSPIRFEQVQGSAQVAAGDDSAIEWTRAEVERIVQVAMDHARSTPHLSLGVLALTAALANEVETTLRRQLQALATHDRTDAAMAFFAEERDEPFVVTSLDTAYVRRDVLVLGVGYGRTLHGRVLHRFPSLAAPGAEHRLTAAASGARRQLIVVSSLSSEELDPGRLRTPGAWALRDLLARAAAVGEQAADQMPGPAVRSAEAVMPEVAGGSAVAESAGAAPSGSSSLNPLLADLATRLRQEGLTVTPHVGPGRHPVELAVGHPSVGARFLVAVESDGPEYAGVLGSRARDRLRVEQLELLGWRPVRVWTTDLYRDPAREVARIVAAVRDARRATRADEGPSAEDDRSTGDAPATMPERSTDDGEGESQADDPSPGSAQSASDEADPDHAPSADFDVADEASEAAAGDDTGEVEASEPAVAEEAAGADTGEADAGDAPPAEEAAGAEAGEVEAGDAPPAEEAAGAEADEVEAGDAPPAEEAAGAEAGEAVPDGGLSPGQQHRDDATRSEGRAPADATETAPERPGGDATRQPVEPEGQDSASASVRGGHRRRRRVRQTPEQSTDDTDRGWGETSDGGVHDLWLLEQRPPHWE
ncbi:MAG: DNA helicase [Dermatophilaceae bacterium]